MMHEQQYTTPLAVIKIDAAGSKPKPSRCGSTGKHHVTIGVNLYTDTVMPFNFNALQGTDSKCVESVQWLAGGDGNDSGRGKEVFLPSIEINARRSSDVDCILSKMAAGDILIPKISTRPTKLSCCIAQANESDPNGKETFDLVLQFELRKTSPNPEEWDNWGLEFLHNQLYDTFAAEGAQKMNHPFQATLARGIVWKTELHMKEFLAQSELVLQSLSQGGGPSHLASSSVSTSKKIYLHKNGLPTNFFKHNMKPPYTSNMDRCLITNVINKEPFVTNVGLPLLASSVAETVSLGMKKVTSVVSPLAAAATARAEDDLSSAVLTFAKDDTHKDDLKLFNYELYLKMKIKKVQSKIISQEQAKDLDLKKAFESNPKIFCMKQVRGNTLILCKCIDNKYRVVVPKSMQEDLLQRHHDCLVSPTVESNFDTAIYDVFTWNGIRDDVKHYVEKARQTNENLQRQITPIIKEINVNEKKEKKKWWKKTLLTKKKGQNAKSSDSSSPFPSFVRVPDKKLPTDCSVSMGSSPFSVKKLSTASTVSTSGVSSVLSGHHPTLTEEEDDYYYRLIADLHGVETENLKVDFLQGGRVLKLSGTQQISRGNLSETNHFERSVTLDADRLDTAVATSNMSNGVLTVTIPRIFQPVTVIHHPNRGPASMRVSVNGGGGFHGFTPGSGGTKTTSITHHDPVLDSLRARRVVM